MFRACYPSISFPEPTCLLVSTKTRSSGNGSGIDQQDFRTSAFTAHAWLGLFGVQSHSRPQSLRSFWPVVGIESSGLVQHRKSVIHGLPVKSSKSDWLTMRNEYSAHAQDIGSGQSFRSQPQARRIVGSGDENGPEHSRPQSLRFFWSRGRRNGVLLVNDILRRVALGTRMSPEVKSM